jgi:hypothetical protein
LNPIDCRIWEILEKKVCRGRSFENIDLLKAAIVEEWEKFPQNSIDKAVDAFRRRLGACVAEDGGPIEFLFL